jgi:hypothetical protein
VTPPWCKASNCSNTPWASTGNQAIGDTGGSTPDALPRLSFRQRTSASRQPHRKLGKITDLAIDRDGAAVLLRYDLVADRQTKPGALAGWLGREKRLEQLVPIFRRNTDAIIAHDAAEDTRYHHQLYKKPKTGVAPVDQSVESLCRSQRAASLYLPQTFRIRLSATAV